MNIKPITSKIFPLFLQKQYYNKLKTNGNKFSFHQTFKIQYLNDGIQLSNTKKSSSEKLSFCSNKLCYQKWQILKNNFTSIFGFVL